LFERLGTVIYRFRWLTLGLALVLLLASLAMVWRGGELTTGTIGGLEAEAAQKLVDQVVGHAEDTTFVAIFHSADLDPDDEAFTDALSQALEPLRADPAVAGVMTSETAPPAIGLTMANSVTHSVLAFISLKGDLKHALQSYPEVRAKLRSSRLEITCTGRMPFVSDLNRTLEHDLLRAEIVSLPLALLILLLVFRTLVAALLPIGVGCLAVLGGVAVVLGLSRVTDIAQYTINVCSLIGLGVAIDYSLFTVSRYREELVAGHDYPEALRRAMATSGRVVAFSGAAVGTGLGGLLFFEHSYLWAMGVGGAVVVSLSVLFALTFLPALLAVLGPRIDWGRLPFGSLAPSGKLWHRTAEWVMRRPIRILVPTVALLLFMAVPFWHLRMAAADVTVLPSEVEARRGYELLKASFPEEAETRIEVVASFPSAPALNADRIGALYDLSRRIAKMPGVTKVESLVDGAPFDKAGYQRNLLNPPAEYAQVFADAKKLVVGDKTVTLYALTGLPPQSDPARAIVRAIRSDRKVADGTLLVGGQTAIDVDTTHYMLVRSPRAMAMVVGVTLLVLFLLLGSVVLPLKAVVMNFFSIAGSFGALVWVFQDGHLFVHHPRPVEPSLPILLFCVLFGLSMDYEVLMLSRIKESYDHSRDNTQAVADGLERTAGVITSAAAIMVAVFGAFSLASVIVIQAVGLGMALAVALDATLIRVLMVPATMRLFGDLNWWAPPVLKRFQRWVGLGVGD
jgi:RND superfamily putative drug exporter